MAGTPKTPSPQHEKMRFLNSVLLTTGRAHEQRLMGRQKFEVSFGSRGRDSLSFLKKNVVLGSEGGYCQGFAASSAVQVGR